MDRDANALRLKSVGPFNDRCAFEYELRGQGHARVRTVLEIVFPTQRIHYGLVAAIRVNVFVAFGVSSDVQALKTMLIEQACTEQLHRILKIAVRFIYAARQKQGLGNTDICIAFDPVFQRRAVRDDAGREVGHYRKSLVIQALGGLDHFFNRSAVEVGNVNAGALRQDLAEVFDFGGRTWHNLDREAVKETRQSAVASGCRRCFALEVQDCHEVLPVHAEGPLCPAIIVDQCLDPDLIVFRLDSRNFRDCDLFIVTFDRIGFRFAPFGQIRVSILRADLHGSAIDRLFESLGQLDFMTTTALATNHLSGDVAPVYYGYICHFRVSGFANLAVAVPCCR